MRHHTDKANDTTQNASNTAETNLIQQGGTGTPLTEAQPTSQENVQIVGGTSNGIEITF
jgi:hypothetical protein